MPIDPTLEHCSCGYSWRPGTLSKIVMLVRGKYVKRCPRCGAVLTLHLSHFVYVSKREQTRDNSIWRRG